MPQQYIDRNGSPISAFCGLNGTGKSTLLQLAAASCKRPNAQAELPTYYIKDFLVAGKLHPNPFSDQATVEYKFWEQDRSLKSLRISRVAATKRWSGYGRRPERVVLFEGLARICRGSNSDMPFPTRRRLDSGEYRGSRGSGQDVDFRGAGPTIRQHAAEHGLICNTKTGGCQCPTGHKPLLRSTHGLRRGAKSIFDRENRVSPFEESCPDRRT